MGPATRQQEVLEDLRRQIRRIERRPERREGFLSCGRADVDALLPGGGFPRGALSALSGGPASGKTGVALAALREAQASGALAAFVDGRGELYPPAALALGVDLARLLIVRPERVPARGDRSRDRNCDRSRGAREAALPGLWAAEVLLASGAFAAVAIDVSLHALPGARAEAMLRRLRAAAEKGGTVGLLLAAPGGPAIPAALRLDLDGARLRPLLRAVRAGEGGRGG
jgi:protein ImuA